MLSGRSSEVLNLPTPDDTDSLGGSENSSSNSTFSLNRTVRDFGQKINSLQRENFDLKLRIFLLEERLSVKDRTEVPSPLHQYQADQQVGSWHRALYITGVCRCLKRPI